MQGAAPLLSPPFPLCKCCLAASASVENKEQDMDTFRSSTQDFHPEHSSLSKVQPLGARVKTDNKKICKCGLFPLCVCQKHAYFHVCMVWTLTAVLLCSRLRTVLQFKHSILYFFSLKTSYTVILEGSWKELASNRIDSTVS